MSIRTIFTEHQIKILESNPNVLHVREKAITYTPSFKLFAVKSNASGKTPTQIFLEAGFDVILIGTKKPKECLKRWREAYASYGEAGLLEERRGKGGTGRPSTKELTIEDKLKRAEAKIKLLEVENDFLKKLDALERQVKR
jgi:hypothetical protein